MNGGYQGMGVSGYVPEVGNAQEVVFSLSGGLGEATTGGPQMNIIGKQGGNKFAGSFFISGTGSAFQGDNLTPELKAKGLTTPRTRSRSCGTSTRRSAARSSATSCGSSAPTATRSAGRTSPACGSTRTPAIPTKWTYDAGPEPAGDRRRHVEERLGAADLAGDAAQQDQRLDERPVQLPALHRAAATVPGLASARSISSPEATATQRKPPEQPDAD